MALIEREAAQRRFENYRRDCEEAGDTVAAQIFADCITELEDAPTIDAAPVVHEKWAWREEWDSQPETRSCDLISCGWYCTGCGIELGDYLTKATGQTVILDDDFCKPKLTCCPSCGARMDGGDGHEAG